MKRIIVLYQSETGFTKQYADWIGEELECEVLDIKDNPEIYLPDYDCAIYGGWIMGNGLVGYNKISNIGAKNVVLFGVGASGNNEELRKKLIEYNKIGDTPFFYMQGGFRFEKLGFFKRMMLKMVRKSLEKKVGITESEAEMIMMLSESSDRSDRKYIDELVSYVRKNYLEELQP